MTTRALRRDERPFSTEGREFPLVIEPRSDRSAAALRALISGQSAMIQRELHDHGALLFRGFTIASEHEFEATVSSIDGVRPMQGYFMSEPDRARVEGTRYVFYTSTVFKTGGAFALGGYHSENYYSADVPALQSFWCKRAPWLGGETGLVHASDLYDDLDEGLRARLEADSTAVTSWPLSDVAQRYGISESALDAFCREAGLFVFTRDGRSRIGIRKANVIRHPHTGRRSLHANLSGELPRLKPLLTRLFASRYAGWRWALHRASWRNPSLEKYLDGLVHVPRLFTKPRDVLAVARSFVRERSLFTRKVATTPSPGRAAPTPVRLVNQIRDDELELLARALFRRTSAFTWRRGDVLVFDNRQVLHAGLPGVGPRELRVMLCNPIPMKGEPGCGTLEPPASDEGYQSVETRLQGLRHTVPTG